MIDDRAAPRANRVAKPQAGESRPDGGGDTDLLNRAAYGCLVVAIPLASWNALRITENMTFGDPLLLLASLILGATWLLRGHITGVAPPWILVPPGMLLASGLLAILAADDSGSLVQTLRFSVTLAAMPLIVMLAASTRGRLERLADCWLLAAVVTSVVGIVDLLQVTSIGSSLTSTDFLAGTGRVSGLTLHPNHLGLVAAMALPVAASKLSARGCARATGIVALPSLLGGVAVSGSRGALVAGVGGVVMFYLFQSHSSRSPGAAVLAAAIVAAVAVLALSPAAGDQFGVVTRERLDGGSYTTESDTARRSLFADALSEGLDNPLIGQGFERVRAAHNIYVQLLQAGGVLALTGFLIFAIGLMRRAHRFARIPSGAAPALPAIAAASGASIGTWLLFGVVGNALYDRYLYVPAGLVLAIGLVSHRSATPAARRTEMRDANRVPSGDDESAARARINNESDVVISLTPARGVARVGPVLGGPERRQALQMTAQTTLRDYVRLLRRYWRMIALAMCALIALTTVLSVQKSTVYAAKSSLQLEDETRDLGLLGAPVAPSSTPEQRAAQGAETVLRVDVLERLKKRLGLERSTAELLKDIKASPDDESNLVVIEARDSDPQSAATLANTVAELAVDEQERQARARFSAAARRLQGRLRGIPRDDPSRVVFAERIAQLEALASIAVPARIAAEATAPGSPVSPRPVRDASIGGVLGLMLGLGLAAVRNSLDQRVRGGESLRQELDLPLLGHVPREMMGHVGFGANDRMTPDKTDLEAFRILRTNLELLFPNGGMRSIAVTSALPGEGKSTVAASLAFAFAFAGSRTLLLECDLRRPVLAERMAMEGSPGLADYLAGKAEPHEVIRTVALHQADDDDDATGLGGQPLVCMFAGTIPVYPTELLNSPSFPALVAELSEAYETIVVDTSPLLLVADTLEVLSHMDVALLCVRTSQTTHEQALAARDILGNLAPKPAGLVLTGVKPSGEDRSGYYSHQRYGYARR